MERNGGTRRATVGALAAAFLVLLAIPSLAPGAQAQPVAPGGVTTTGSQWAYGGWTWANSSLTFPNGTLQVTSFFGWHTIYTVVNATNSTSNLEVERTAAAKLDATFCSPDCAHPTVSASLALHGWEQSFSFVNLTRSANVTLNGSAVAAWGIANESGRSRANLTEQVAFNQSGATARTLAAYLAVDAQGTHAIAFGTPLGVVPVGVRPGESWNSSAAYTASGRWNASGLDARTGYLGSTDVLRFAPSGSFNGSGELGLYGSDLGRITLHNGVSTQVIALALEGPYAMHEGFLLIPSTLDIFSSGLHPWDRYGVAAALLHTDRIDLTSSGDGAPEVNAAASGYSGAASAVTPTGPAPLAPAAATAGPAGELQAQPESPATAAQASNCLVGNCPASGPAAFGIVGGLGLAIVIALLAGLVVGTVGVVEYRVWSGRQHRSRDLVGATPEPSRAALPPGTTLSSPTRPATPRGGVPPSVAPETESPTPRGPA